MSANKYVNPLNMLISPASTVIGVGAGTQANINDFSYSTGMGGGVFSALTTGNYNCGFGYNCLENAVDVGYTCGFGYQTLTSLATTGQSGNDAHAAFGAISLVSLTGGQGNSAFGQGAGQNLINGSYNFFGGYNCGNSYNGSESGNILLGALGTSGESNTTRIGWVNSASSTQTACYLDGVYGVSPSSPSMVIIDSSGQLGSQDIPSGDISIAGDSGIMTGSSFTIYANQAGNACGQTVLFSNSGTTSTFSVTDGSYNTMVGSGSGASGYTASYCTAFGANTLTMITDDSYHAAFGVGALQNANDSQYNSAFGVNALNAVTSGGGNTGVGYGAGVTLQTGNYCTLVGYMAGSAYTSTESNNVVLGSVGVVGESNVLRLGDAGSGSGQVNAAYIAGIYGNSPSSAQMVTINSSGQLGSQSIPSTGIVTLDGTSGSATGSTITFSGGTTGLTLTGSGSTLTLGGSLANANLAHSSITVTAGTGLSGGGTVSLGGSVTLNATGGSSPVVAIARASSNTPTNSSTTLDINAAAPTTSNTTSLISITYTPTSSSNYLNFDFCTFYSINGAEGIWFFLFQGSTLIGVFPFDIGSSTIAAFKFSMQAGTTSSTTYSVYYAGIQHQAYILTNTGTVLYNSSGIPVTQFMITETTS